MTAMPNNLLRQIPKVDAILESAGWKSLVSGCPEALAKEVLRENLDTLRLAIKEGRATSIPSIEEIVRDAGIGASALVEPGLKRVINATGIVIHTNLGRSLLAGRAIDAIVRSPGATPTWNTTSKRVPAAAGMSIADRSSGGSPGRKRRSLSTTTPGLYSLSSIPLQKGKR